MKKTSVLSKLILVFFGLVLGILLIETLLHTGGYLYKWRQKSVFHNSIDSRNTVKILCLGESTTAGFRHSYPAQLQTILDREYPGRSFVIFNGGLPSTNSTHIAENLDQFLRDYDPDLVVTMIGINDRPEYVFYKRSRFKLVNLLRLLIEHLKNITNQDFRTKQLPDRTQTEAVKTTKHVHSNTEEYAEIIEHGKAAFLNGDYRLAVEYFQAASEIEPRRPEPYFRLGESYRELGIIHIARQSYKKALERDEQHCGALLGMGWCYIAECSPERAEVYFNTVVTADPYNQWAHYGLGLCHEQQKEYTAAYSAFAKALDISPDNKHVLKALGRLVKIEEVPPAVLYEKNISSRDGFDESHQSDAAWYMYRNEKYAGARDMFKEAFRVNPTDYISFFYQALCHMKLNEINEAIAIYTELLEVPDMKSHAQYALITAYEKNGDPDSAAAFRRAAQVYSDTRVNPHTLGAYRRIAKTLRDANIQHVAVQYPMRPLGDLQKILDYANDIIYVDNEESFVTAVHEYGYDAIFVDNFAGDFGHCTEKGNRILAENVARAILKDLFDHEV
jgi:tetratricopeptide (TPR) repeat protein